MAWPAPCSLAHPLTLQELIIQNFRAKQGTAMAATPEPPLSDLLWTVALARLLLGPQVCAGVQHSSLPASTYVLAADHG